MSRLVEEIKSICLADHIILGYPSLKTQKNTVNLHYYHAEQVDKTQPNTVNLGDYLSEVVVSYMLNKKCLSLDAKAKTAHLYAIGSIILMGYQNATIWGSGFPYEPGAVRSLPHRFRRLDVRAVRGPYTRNTLMHMGFECPEVYGDPAVLMPLIYTPINVGKTREYVFVPHYQMEHNIPKCIDPNNILSMNTKDYRAVIGKICSAKKVISSSLHGIILAEAYGIPAVFYNDRPERFNYKYEDWYVSTGRKCYPAKALSEAIDMPSPSLPDLTDMQHKLLESFPYDLWKK